MTKAKAARDWRDMSRKEQVLLFVICTCDELKKKGLIEGGLDATPAGRAMFREMKKAGFKLTQEEVVKTMSGLQAYLVGSERGYPEDTHEPHRD